MSHLTGILDNWAHQTIWIDRVSTAFDSYGNPVVSTSSSYTAIIQQVNRPVRTAQGIDKVSTVQILFKPTTNIGISDIITLPDGQQPTILSIERTVDFDGNLEYVKVFT